MSNLLNIILMYLLVILILSLPVIWIVNIANYWKLLHFILTDKSTKDYLLAADLKGFNKLSVIYNRTKCWFLHDNDKTSKSIKNNKKVCRESFKISFMIMALIIFLFIIIFILAHISM